MAESSIFHFENINILNIMFLCLAFSFNNKYHPRAIYRELHYFIMLPTTLDVPEFMQSLLGYLQSFAITWIAFALNLLNLFSMYEMVREWCVQCIVTHSDPTLSLALPCENKCFRVCLSCFV